jgi:hypothetical protein
MKRGDWFAGESKMKPSNAMRPPMENEPLESPPANTLGSLKPEIDFSESDLPPLPKPRWLLDGGAAYTAAQMREYRRKKWPRDEP